MAAIFATEFLEHLITYGLELVLNLSGVLSQLKWEHSSDVFTVSDVLKAGWDILSDCK